MLLHFFHLACSKTCLCDNIHIQKNHHINAFLSLHQQFYQIFQLSCFLLTIYKAKPCCFNISDTSQYEKRKSPKKSYYIFVVCYREFSVFCNHPTPAAYKTIEIQKMHQFHLRKHFSRFHLQYVNAGIFSK